MYMLPILFFFIFILTKIIAPYDSRFSEGKYVAVKNKKAAKLLIDKKSFYSRDVTLQKDRNKMTVAGLIFYLCLAFVIILTAVLLIIPQIPCTPFEIDAAKLYLRADTLNGKIAIVSATVLLCSEFVYTALLVFKSRKTVEEKKTRVFLCIVAALTAFCGIFAAISCFI